MSIESLAIGAAVSVMDLSTLKAFDAACVSAITGLTAAKAAKVGVLVSITNTLAPLQAQKVILTAALDKAKNAVSIIPLDQVRQYPILGPINTTISSVVSQQLGTVQQILFQINCLFAENLRIQSEIVQADTYIAYFQSIRDAIAPVLKTKGG